MSCEECRRAVIVSFYDVCENYKFMDVEGTILIFYNEISTRWAIKKCFPRRKLLDK